MHRLILVWTWALLNLCLRNLWKGPFIVVLIIISLLIVVTAAEQISAAFLKIVDAFLSEMFYLRDVSKLAFATAIFAVLDVLIRINDRNQDIIIFRVCNFKAIPRLVH